MTVTLTRFTLQPIENCKLCWLSKQNSVETFKNGDCLCGIIGELDKVASTSSISPSLKLIPHLHVTSLLLTPML